MFGANPPDDFIGVDISMYIFGRQLGFPDSAHARDDLHVRGLPAEKIADQSLELGGPAGEVDVAGRDLARPEPVGRPGHGLNPARRRALPRPHRRFRLMILGPTADERRVRLAPPRRDVILGPPRRLPQGEKDCALLAAVERLDDLLEKSPTGHLGPAEKVVHG
jgi:hypothetical protein